MQVGETALAILLSPLLPILLLLLLWVITGFLATLHALRLAKHLFERTNLAKKQVAGGSPELAVGTDVIGPGKPGNELVRLQIQIFQSQEMLEGTLLFGWSVGSKADVYEVLARDRIANPKGLNAKIIKDSALKGDFLYG